MAEHLPVPEEFRYVFVDGGRYFGRVPAPPRGRSHASQRQLKARIGARTLVLLDPRKGGYLDWLDRVPFRDRI